MSLTSDLFSGGASKLVDSVGNTVDKVVAIPSEKIQLDNEIRKARMDYELEMQKLSVEERRMMYNDLSSARTREQTIQQSASASRLGKNVSSYLAIVATLLCFALFYILVFNREIVSAESKDIIIYILGVLSALLTQVYSYYFGSSSGSADKTRVLENHLNEKDGM
ncbi:MAG TPA: hypothetical protein PKO16_06795 [Bacteroidia bacterium]|jgi:hypothetical protein|nr:hypothetical protein [Bacteroidia bacterium]